MFSTSKTFLLTVSGCAGTVEGIQIAASIVRMGDQNMGHNWGALRGGVVNTAKSFAGPVVSDRQTHEEYEGDWPDAPANEVEVEGRDTALADEEARRLSQERRYDEILGVIEGTIPPTPSADGTPPLKAKFSADGAEELAHKWACPHAHGEHVHRFLKKHNAGAVAEGDHYPHEKSEGRWRSKTVPQTAAKRKPSAGSSPLSRPIGSKRFSHLKGAVTDDRHPSRAGSK